MTDIELKIIEEPVKGEEDKEIVEPAEDFTADHDGEEEFLKKDEEQEGE